MHWINFNWINLIDFELVNPNTITCNNINIIFGNNIRGGTNRWLDYGADGPNYQATGPGEKRRCFDT